MPGGSSRPMRLDGPEQHHVYLGHHRGQRGLSDEFTRKLEERQFIVYRQQADGAVMDSVESGIKYTQWIVFLMTEAYATDEDWFQYEKREALDKMKNQGNRMMMLILKDFAEAHLPEDLKGYQTIVYRDGDGDDNQEMWNEIFYSLSQITLPLQANIPKDNMGYTLACSHFCGYLRFVLPGLAQRISEKNISKEGENVIMSSKMIAVVPESCWCPADLSEFCNPGVTYFGDIRHNVDKGAVRSRDYKAVVYTVKARGREYRAVIEFPGVLSTLYDMANLGMYENHRKEQFLLFYYHLRALLQDPRFDLQKRIKLIYYNGKSFGERTPFLDTLVDVIEGEIKEERENPVPLCNSIAMKDELTSLKSKPSPMKVLRNHGKLSRYRIRSTQGARRAYILNNEEFDFATGLGKRNGSDKDLERMKELFTELRFDCKIYTNKTAAEIKDTMALISTQVNFSEVDVVAFCLMSHGKLGQLYGTDGGLVGITELTRMLADVPTLLRKPKLFFVQACQRGKDVASPSVDTTNNASSPPSLGVSERGDASGIARAYPSDSSFDDSDYSLTECPGGAYGGRGDASADIPVMVRAMTLREPEEQLSGCLDDVQPDVDEDGQTDPNAQADLVPGAPDFFMSYATLPGSLSFRHIKLGAIYIEQLYKVMSLSDHEPLDRKMMIVMKNVKEIMRGYFPNELKGQQFPFYVPTTEQLIDLSVDGEQHQ